MALGALVPWVLCALVELAGAAVWAHDMWIEPSSFTPAVGSRIAVRLRIGQQFQGDPFPRDPDLIKRFSAVGGGREAPIPGIPGVDPAGFFVPESPGAYLLVYGSGRSAVQLDGAKFEQYLSEEGLDKVAALRSRRGQKGQPAREVFSRCAKSLIAAGASAGGGFSRVLGLTLELVPEGDPATLSPGQQMPLHLLYQGSPLAGAKVTAIPKGHPAEQVSARSGPDGEVRLPLARPGVWLIKAVNMIPAPAGAGADWESFWASVTFELKPAAAKAASSPDSPRVGLNLGQLAGRTKGELAASRPSARPH